MAKNSRVPPMLKRVVSNFFTKAATRMYPLEKPQLPEDFRGLLVFDIKLCIGCGLCSRDCPARAIEMVKVEGKNRPQFRLEKCIFCYQCAESCARNAIKSSTHFELATTNKASLIMRPQTCVQTC
jgi:formate hydrogenlyase subunit 6/NADH:ubiquinone oxidoreductase subunit I